MKGLEEATERRRQTRNRIFSYIYESKDPVSKQNIANNLGYSLPTIHQNITELLNAGLIKVGEVQKPHGGRPPVGYIVDKDVRYALGITISANHIRMLASDIMQGELAFKKINISHDDMVGIDRRLRDEIDIFLKENNLDPAKNLGVGITFPGILDASRDRMVLSPSMKFKNFSLEKISQTIPYPVFIENDSTCAGFAEWMALAPEEREKGIVYLLLEEGVGGAVFINGKPYGGSSSRSGEFGHMCVQPEGLLCNCGKRGCLEAYCTAFRFTRDINVTIEEFFDSLHKGNPIYTSLWNDVLSHLAIGINNIRMSFDCDVILGGFVSEYLEPYLPQLRSMVSDRNPFEEDAEFIHVGKYPKRAGMRGVAWHFTNDFIQKL